MYKNHYDARQVCMVKIDRLKTIIDRIQEAESMLEVLPHDLLQTAWNKVIDKMENSRLAGQERAKPISKGVYRRSMRKTLQCLKVEQQKALNEVKERLEEAKVDLQRKEQILLQQLKSHLAEQRALLASTQ